MKNADEIIRALRLCADKSENCEECRSGQCDCPFGETVLDCTERMNRAAADAIEALAGEVPHWIPVGERLPKESGHYLVISKMNWAHGGNWEDDSGDIRRHIAIAFFDRVVKFNIPYVTHWQPLPAAPKEEK